ncbi:DNA replication complex GINS protein PSF1 isoform X1 [Anopheles gambiae]|uniref:DNA replication complex GINS protein PSF1 isoform X1 n=1 Tax=Anopheles gambiae TaxID=7165 RepID=UPI002AC9A4B9|nr:DNA replication complex GINS protein PSF1 isoform X1 [Anopheles gambiae]
MKGQLIPYQRLTMMASVLCWRTFQRSIKKIMHMRKNLLHGSTLFSSSLANTRFPLAPNRITFNETGDRKLLPLVMYRHNLIKRQKRCVLAYLSNRLFRLKRLRWHVGPILPPEIKSCINDPESAWFNKYSRILAEYMASIHDGYGLNLTNDIKPPKSLYIEVRCLTDYGKFELESGEIVLLKKNSQHYLPKLQCEQLIRQGILQHIT